MEVLNTIILTKIKFSKIGYFQSSFFQNDTIRKMAFGILEKILIE